MYNFLFRTKKSDIFVVVIEQNISVSVEEIENVIKIYNIKNKIFKA